jgi:hypothetical protein
VVEDSPEEAVKALFSFMVIAIVVLVIVFIRQTSDEDMAQRKRVTGLRHEALVLMGVYAVFWLLFGISEISAGDVVGAILLAQAIATGGLMFIVRRQPIAGGIAFLSVGVFLSILYSMQMYGGWFARDQVVLITGVPPLVAGLIFLGTSQLASPSR